MLRYFVSGFLAIMVVMSAVAANAGDKRPNILFIAVDDLRPELGAFGADYMVTPNIDKLAEDSFSFTNHFVQAPTCGASRFAMLTGRIPRTKAQINNEAIRTEIGDAEGHDYISFPRYFRESGYATVALGKIGHYPGGTVAPYTGVNENPRPELPNAWDISKAPTAEWGTEQNGFFAYAGGRDRNTLKGQVPHYEAGDVDDMGYPDGHIAQMAVEQIKTLSEQDKPFLLAVGFYKPHLPFNAPKKYWDLYNRDEIPLSPNPYVPENLPESNILAQSGEFNNYKIALDQAVAGKAVSEEFARALRHGYFAAVSYADAQIGKVLDALEASGQADNTIVVLWGDHGWQLGDHTLWAKHNLYERSLKSPLIVRVPAKNPASKHETRVVETVDIYPTLVDLAGLPRPEKLSGKNLFDAASDGIARSFWKNSVSLTTSRYHIIVHGEKYPDDVELYDHATDPYETKNVAADHADIGMPLFEEALTLMLRKK